MNLYFGNRITTITTLLLVVLIAYMIVLVKKRYSFKAWGRHILLLDVLGLLICCTATARDGLHLTIQNAIDGSCAPGLFSLISIPTIAGVIGATMIVFSGLVCIFIRKQNIKRVLCFICMMGIALKIVVVEISRFIM